MHVLLGLIAVVSTMAVQSSAQAADDRTQRCLQVMGPAAAGSVPLSENFVTVKCDAGVESTFRHDSTIDFSRTTRPLSVGEIVPVYPEFDQDIVRPGEALNVVVASGSILVERRVEAVQSARP